MPQRAKRPRSDEAAKIEENLPSADEKIARLLGFFMTKDMKQTEQVRRLSGIGFTNSGVAAILGITSNNVAVALYQYKKQSKSKK